MAEENRRNQEENNPSSSGQDNASQRAPVTEIYCSRDTAREFGPILVHSPYQWERIEAAQFLGGYKALSYLTLLPLLAGLADPNPEVYATVVLAISRLHC